MFLFITTANIVFLLVLARLCPLTARLHIFLGSFLELLWNSLRVSHSLIAPTSSVGVRLASVSYILFLFWMFKLICETLGFIGVAIGMAVYGIFALDRRCSAAPEPYHLPDTVRKRPAMRKPTRPEPLEEKLDLPPPCELSGVRCNNINGCQHCTYRYGGVPQTTPEPDKSEPNTPEPNKSEPIADGGRVPEGATLGTLA